MSNNPIAEDYTEDDRWDWDRDDSSQRCIHGTFIGSWWGPDILCQYCEDGISVEECNEIIRERRIATWKRWLVNFSMQEMCTTWNLRIGGSSNVNKALINIYHEIEALSDKEVEQYANEVWGVNADRWGEDYSSNTYR